MKNMLSFINIYNCAQITQTTGLRKCRYKEVMYALGLEEYECTESMEVVEEMQVAYTILGYYLTDSIQVTFIRLV